MQRIVFFTVIFLVVLFGSSACNKTISKKPEIKLQTLCEEEFSGNFDTFVISCLNAHVRFLKSSDSSVKVIVKGIASDSQNKPFTITSKDNIISIIDERMSEKSGEPSQRDIFEIYVPNRQLQLVTVKAVAVEMSASGLHADKVELSATAMTLCVDGAFSQIVLTGTNVDAEIKSADNIDNVKVDATLLTLALECSVTDFSLNSTTANCDLFFPKMFKTGTVHVTDGSIIMALPKDSPLTLRSDSSLFTLQSDIPYKIWRADEKNIEGLLTVDMTAGLLRVKNNGK